MGVLKTTLFAVLLAITAVIVAVVFQPGPAAFPASEPLDFGYPNEIQSEWYTINGVKLHSYRAGPVENAKGVILFVHGFPGNQFCKLSLK